MFDAHQMVLTLRSLNRMSHSRQQYPEREWSIPNMTETDSRVAAIPAEPDSIIRPGERRALAAALVTVTLWASAFIGIRSAGEELSPGALSLGRLLVGSFMLGAVAVVRGEPLPARRD